MTELDADGIPVVVTCRVLKLSRQPYYRWLADPITESEVVEAYRANALFDAHREDPEFGHRLLADEARDAGEAMSDRTAWRIASMNGWFSAFGKPKRGRSRRPGPPVHDDLCAVVDEDGRTRHVFAADAPNQLWLTDITEHKTVEGKLYLCAIKDVYSGRIVGYSIDSRMKSRLAVQALENAVQVRGDVAGCVVHSDRGSQFRSRKMLRALARHRMVGSMGKVGSSGDNAAMDSFFALLQKERPRPPLLDHTRTAADRDSDLDRADLPPPTPSSPPGPFDAHRVRDHHEHDRRTGGVTTTCHLSMQQTRARICMRCSRRTSTSS
ncbi:transposase InsO family protein [Pseudoclavibacter chungangensis]|nr:transposase InsO family protein [Pseudoclavibacter chungangensis]